MIGILSACDDDDNISDSNLEGGWNLVSYTFFGPELPELNDGDVKWTFNVINSTVVIENNVAATYPFMEDLGTYNYTIFNDIIAIDGVGDYQYTVTENELRMDSNTNPAISADGPILRFEKN